MNAYAAVTATRAISNATRGYSAGKLSLLLAHSFVWQMLSGVHPESWMLHVHES